MQCDLVVDGNAVGLSHAHDDVVGRLGIRREQMRARDHEVAARKRKAPASVAQQCEADAISAHRLVHDAHFGDHLTGTDLGRLCTPRQRERQESTRVVQHRDGEGSRDGSPREAVLEVHRDIEGLPARLQARASAQEEAVADHHELLGIDTRERDGSMRRRLAADADLCHLRVNGQ